MTREQEIKNLIKVHGTERVKEAVIELLDSEKEQYIEGLRKAGYSEERIKFFAKFK